MNFHFQAFSESQKSADLFNETLLTKTLPTPSMVTQRRILRPSSNQFLLDFYSQLVLRLESFIWSLREVVAVFRHKLQLKFGSKVANSVHKFTLKVHSDMKISLFIFSLCLRICLSFFFVLFMNEFDASNPSTLNIFLLCSDLSAQTAPKPSTPSKIRIF